MTNDPETAALRPNAKDSAFPPEAIVETLPVINKKGLHARATAKFVQCVESFDCEISVARNGDIVAGDSIMGILTLGAGVGSTITIAAIGPQAKEAVAALAQLVANRFGEEE